MAAGLIGLAHSVLSDEPDGAQVAREMLPRLYVAHNSTLEFDMKGVRFTIYRYEDHLTVYLHTGTHTYAFAEEVPESWTH